MPLPRDILLDSVQGFISFPNSEFIINQNFIGSSKFFKVENLFFLNTMLNPEHMTLVVLIFTLF